MTDELKEIASGLFLMAVTAGVILFLLLAGVK